jgi:hypothetical protein
VCTHSEHQAHTCSLKDPAASVRKSQDCGDTQKPACTKVLKRKSRYDAPVAALSSPSQDVTLYKNRPEHWPSAMRIRENGYARY